MLAKQPRPPHRNLSCRVLIRRGCARAWCRYEHLAAALKAQEALNGREFDGNKVSATFLPE